MALILIPAAGELGRSALRAPRAIEAFGRSGGAAPWLAVTRLPARGSQGRRSPGGASGRDGPRSADVGWARVRRSDGGARPSTARPNQALQRTAYHEAVVRHGSRLPPPLS